LNNFCTVIKKRHGKATEEKRQEGNNGKKLNLKKD